ncbi:MAG TPA: hypothetical protein VEL05_08905 [Candidatus Acidoferrum sp.]|nr:hypothetical protein [Candidatus Acidoferrum sp.]
MARRDDDRDAEPDRLVPADPAELAARDEPPVVARLVVEIRSDGRRTIARGAMEDAASGEGVAIEASGRTPLQLALSLARALFTLPAFGRTAARAILRGPGRRPGDGGDDGAGGR